MSRSMANTWGSDQVSGGAAGRYAPRIETAMQHFRRLLSRDLRSALE